MSFNKRDHDSYQKGRDNAYSTIHKSGSQSKKFRSAYSTSLFDEIKRKIAINNSNLNKIKNEEVNSMPINSPRKSDKKRKSPPMTVHLERKNIPVPTTIRHNPTPPPPIDDTPPPAPPCVGDISMENLTSNSQLLDVPIPSMRTKRLGKNHQRSGSNLINDYKILEKIGMGTYGLVYKAEHNLTGRVVALKRVHLNLDHEGFPITAVREIKILRHLKHENIVDLLEVVRNREEMLNLKKDVFYLVFEYLEHDLSGLIKAPGIHFSCNEIGSIMKQLLKALSHCHLNNYLHRDIKGSNILISSNGRLKLGDFGLARLFNSQDKTRPYTNKVITIGYRPPEILLGEERYGCAIDVWSSGCILGELFSKKPLFKAYDEIEQLEAITRLCGAISPESWPSVVNLPFFKTFCKRLPSRNRIREEFSFIPLPALELLESMLVLDPSCRISTIEALKTPWMTDINIDKIKFLNLPEGKSYHEIDQLKKSSSSKDSKILRNP